MRIFRTAVPLVIALLLVAATLPPKTVILAVPGMTCATCPITVKRALAKVAGVTKVDVSYERLEAVVTLDDARATVAALIAATTKAGYPSTEKPTSILRRAPSTEQPAAPQRPSP